MGFDLKARQVDGHRRVVLPETCPAGSAVTIQEIDEDTWVVKRQRRSERLFVVLDPDIKEIPDDPELDALGEKVAKHSLKKLPRFDEL
jgi:hypothetical protein